MVMKERARDNQVVQLLLPVYGFTDTVPTEIQHSHEACERDLTSRLNSYAGRTWFYLYQEIY